MPDIVWVHLLYKRVAPPCSTLYALYPLPSPLHDPPHHTLSVDMFQFFIIPKPYLFRDEKCCIYAFLVTETTEKTSENFRAGGRKFPHLPRCATSTHFVNKNLPSEIKKVNPKENFRVDLLAV